MLKMKNILFWIKQNIDFFNRFSISQFFKKYFQVDSKLFYFIFGIATEPKKNPFRFSFF